MSMSKKPAGGGGAKAAAQLRAHTSASSVAPRRRAAASPLTGGARSLADAESDSASDDDQNTDDDRHTDDASGSDDGDTDDDDDDASSSSSTRHPSPSSDSDTDPLEPSGGVSVLAALGGKVAPPVFPPAKAPVDAKGRPLPGLSEEEALQVVLDSSGITREDHLRQPHSKAASFLEVFQVSRYRRIQGLTSFGPAVRQLEIMQQNLTCIEGLQALVNLEILYLNNNSIKRISGLEANKKLQELHLGENQVEKIENISHLTHLTALSLYDNCLTGSISGLEGVTRLKKLNLARNKIQLVDNGLDHLSSLVELNLSDNLLGSFTQIRHLSRLKQLEVLYLNDPHHGDNPVCHLCNYHTYALYHLQHLHVLDTIRLTEEATALAEATFLKKQMYYNMRMKVCKGNTSNIIKKANEICKQRVSSINSIRRELLRAYKLVLGELSEHAYENGRSASSGERDLIDSRVLEHRRDALETVLAGYNTQVKTLSSFLQTFSRKMSLLSEQLIHRMVVELETGGNVRFEDGVLGQEPWVLSCVHFLHTHLSTPGLSRRFGLGSAPSLRIRRVTKIHNRALRNRFEEGLESRVETNGDGSPVANRTKPELHYAFYSSTANGAAAPNTEQEAGNPALILAANNGFARDSPAASTADRSGPALVLTNSVLYADLPRLSALQRADPLVFKRGTFSSAPREPAIQGGEIIIAKVYLGSSVTKPAGGAAGVVDAKDVEPFVGARGTDYPTADAVIDEFASESLGSSAGAKLASPSHAGKAEDVSDDASSSDEATKLKRIHVFDRHMVLPEYIVSFDYVRGDDEAEAAACSYAPPAGEDLELMRLTGNFIGLREPLLDLSTLLARMDRADADAKAAFQALMSPKQMPRTDMIATLERGTPARQRTLQLLHLSDLGIKHLPSLDQCASSLRVLLLNFNVLTRLDGHGFERLVNLERLEVGYNAIRKVAPGVLAGMRTLTHLELPYNALASSKDIATIITDAPNLQVLDLRGNLGLAKPGQPYTPQLIKSLTKLKQLDLVPIESDKYASSGATREQTIIDIEAAKLHPLMQFQGAFTLADASNDTTAEQKKAGTPTSSAILSPYGTAPSASTLSSAAAPVISDQTLMQQCFVDRDSTIKMQQAGASAGSAMTTRRPLSVYTRVRLSDFLLESASSKSSSGELPAHIPPVYFDQVLECELDHHRLSAMPAAGVLGRFINLRKLSFHDNSLTRIDGLEKLTRLEELSLEENNLQRIDGLTTLQSLAKLDLGKNRLATIDVSVSFRGLESCLTQLSLEDNLLRTLAGFESLTNLMELYLGNNQLESMKEVAYLKDLPRLLILDLSGNPLAHLPEYRLYTIFTVKKLKVLDGVAIESSELHAARDLYAGKLTEEMLGEILGHTFFKHIENLDLSSAKIRNMEVISAERFCNLRVLVLDNNQISDLSTLSPLSLLRVLRLNRNRITSIPFHEASGRGLLARCFPHLEVLELGYNRISSIAALHLKGLNELRVLTLESNELTRVDGLSGLTSLQQLVLAKNKIKRFDVGTGLAGMAGRSFAGLTELRGLQLEENGLRSLAGLGSLPKLRALFLAYNRLSELSELDHLSSDRCSPVLQEVTLRNNPLARKHLYRATLIRRVQNTLQSIDGREVTPEEREKSDAIFANTASGPNGEPLIGPAGGMPNGAVYFYADSRPTDKVPIKVQSFNLAGFGDAANLGGALGLAHPHAHAHAASSPTHSSSSHPYFQPGPLPPGLGIGGVSIGGHGVAHMNMNLSSNMLVSGGGGGGGSGNASRASFSHNPTGGFVGGHASLTHQMQQMQLGMGIAGFSTGAQGIKTIGKNRTASIKGRKM